MPPPPRPAASETRGTLGPLALFLFRSAIGAVLITLVLLALDLGLDLRLPQPLRGALPYALAVGLCVALVLGVGAYGKPQPPSRPDRAERADES